MRPENVTRRFPLNKLTAPAASLAVEPSSVRVETNGAEASPLTIRNLCALGAVAIILALPMILYGPMLQGHDTFEHLNYSRHFSQQFWAGEWYPRWLIDMNHGLGSPSLFVYPPFPSYVYSFLQPLGRVAHFDPFRMGEFVALFGSGLTAFLWLSTMAGEWMALAGAALYMLMPYHLAADFYQRTALSECWALVWMPLVLYFSATSKRKPWNVAGLAVAYALLILSHLVSAAIFSLIPLAWAVMFSERGKRFGSIARVAAGMLLGTGLSCFYLIPALAHARYFPVSRMPLWSTLGNNLLTLGKLLHGSDAYVRGITFMLAEMLALCVVCGAVVLLRGNQDSRRKVIFWLAVCVVPVFLMSGPSFRVWKTCSLLLAAVQYPWRLNMVLCLAGAAMITLFFKEITCLPRKVQALLLLLVSLIMLPWIFAYGNVWTRYWTDKAPEAAIVNEDDGWFPAWTPQGTDQQSALEASRGPRARFLAGTGTVDVLRWQPRHIEFQAQSSTGGNVMINQFYYPAWRAALIDPYHALATKAAMPEGLLELDIPAGLHTVRLDIPTGLAERLGAWVSLLCGLLSAALVCKPFGSQNR